MLQLNREKNEEVWIGNDTCITVLELNRNRVKLGFSAPEHVKIWRGEIKHRLKEDKCVSGNTKERFVEEDVDQTKTNKTRRLADTQGTH